MVSRAEATPIALADSRESWETLSPFGPRYVLCDQIGAGGMATVHLGRLRGDGGFVRTVAIKRLRPQFAAEPEVVAAFKEEARIAARVRHPNVVPMLDVVDSEGELGLVMEYVEGQSVA